MLRASRVFLLLSLLAASARAGDRAAEAEAEMVKARAAMKKQEYEIAVGHLLVARSLAPAASGPYLNLGLAYAALRRCDQAVPMLEEYLRRKTVDPQPSAAATLAACRAAMTPAPAPAPPPVPSVPDEQLDEPPPPAPRVVPPPPAPVPRPAHLWVHINPVAADVIVNGLRVARAARLFERDLPAGMYELSVEQHGYQRYAHVGWLREGATTSIHVSLARRRLWPTVVGLLAGTAITGGVIGIGVVAASAPRPGETAFSTETVP